MALPFAGTENADLTGGGAVNNNLNDTPGPESEPMPDDPSSLAAQTQEPRLTLPDEALRQYGLDQAQPGDRVTALVTFRVDAKSPGSSVSGEDGGTTDFAVESVSDVQDANTASGSDEPEDESDTAEDEPAPEGGDEGGSDIPPASQGDKGGGDEKTGDLGGEGDVENKLGFKPRKRSKALSPKDINFK